METRHPDAPKPGRPHPDVTDAPHPEATDAPPEATPPPELRFLKWLVTLLAGVMILGIVSIVALLAFRLRPLPPPPAPPALPDHLELPEGARASAVTMGTGWIAVVTSEGAEILIYDSATGALRQRIAID